MSVRTGFEKAVDRAAGAKSPRLEKQRADAVAAKKPVAALDRKLAKQKEGPGRDREDRSAAKSPIQADVDDDDTPAWVRGSGRKGAGEPGTAGLQASRTAAIEVQLAADPACPCRSCGCCSRSAGATTSTTTRCSSLTRCLHDDAGDRRRAAGRGRLDRRLPASCSSFRRSTCTGSSRAPTSWAASARSVADDRAGHLRVRRRGAVLRRASSAVGIVRLAAWQGNLPARMRMVASVMSILRALGRGDGRQPLHELVAAHAALALGRAVARLAAGLDAPPAAARARVLPAACPSFISALISPREKSAIGALLLAARCARW